MKQSLKIHKKLLVWLLIFSVCLGTVAPSQWVFADARVGKVTATNLTVREGAGTSYGKMGTLPKGTEIVILGEKTDASGDVWYQISYEGETAYVSGDYVEVASPRIGIVTTSSSSLTVRKGAGSTYDKIGSVAKGAEVTILAEATDAEGIVWYQIAYQNSTGYVCGTYITLKEAGNDDPAPDEPDDPTPDQPDDPAPGAPGDSEPAEPDQPSPGVPVVDVEPWTGKVTSSSLNMRSDPSASALVVGTGLARGNLVTVLGEAKASDGSKWYKINYEGLIGFCAASYIEAVATEKVDADPEFEAYLDEQGFPESYKEKLRVLHVKYPNWVFVAQFPKLDWEEAVYEQYKFGDMLPSGWVGTKAVSILWKYNTPASWKSLDSGAFDWTDCTWTTGWDGSAWNIPSEELVAYYLDPRNFLEKNTIFQFLDMSFDGDVQTVDGVKAMASASSGSRWLAETVTDQDGTTLDYSAAIYEAGKDYGISPYILLSIISQEVHRTHGSVSGTYKGYEGYFNFYNIGAYVDRANGFTTAVSRGLWYAKGENKGKTSLGRPWDTRLKAIRGGAQHFAVNYVKKHQETLYLKRFDVFDGGNGLYNHQFSTDIQGPYSEAKKLSAMYSEELRQNALVFNIPVYEDMPAEACEQPLGNDCPNYKLKSLTVDGYELSPAFKTDKTSYTVEVGTASSVTLSAEAFCEDAKVEGTGKLSLALGENVVNVRCVAENGASRTYTLKLIRVREADCPTEKFTDLDPDAWYHENVDYVVAQSLMNGTAEDTFAPDRTTSRAMIVTILYRMSGDTVTEEMKNAVKFTDVSSGRYYTDAVAWAAYHGIVTGKNEKTFAPDEAITREQIMTMLYRYAEYNGFDVTANGDLSDFPDASDISNYAKKTVAWAYGAGLLNGVKQNGQILLQPKGDTIRVQAAAFIHRFCEYMAKCEPAVLADVPEETETVTPESSEPETEMVIPESTEPETEMVIPESAESETETVIPESTEPETETVISESTASETEAVIPKRVESETEKANPETPESETEDVLSESADPRE